MDIQARRWGRGRGGSGETDLAGFLLKVDFTENYTDGCRRRFKSLTKVWSSTESVRASQNVSRTEVVL